MYCGIQQHIKDYKERYAAIEERTTYLRSVIAALEESGGASAIITGSGTGTHHIDSRLGCSPSGRSARTCSWIGSTRSATWPTTKSRPSSIRCSSTRASSAPNTRGIATIDAGYKAMATDGGPPVVLSGAPQGSSFVFMGDEHGLIIDPAQKHSGRSATSCASRFLTVIRQ